MARVLCIGGCHWDIRLVAKQSLVPGESTPVHSTTTPGGAVSNVARALRAKGHQVEIASVVGRNPPEQSAYCKVLPDQDTGRYVTVEHADGTLLYGLADLDLYAAMDAQWYAELGTKTAGFDAVVIDCNAQPQALAAFSPTRTLPIYGVTVSPAKVANFAPLLSRLSGLFLNQAEADVVGQELSQVPWSVKTMGPRGAELLKRGLVVERFDAPAAKPGHVNGLGDRLAGLVLSHLLCAGTHDWRRSLDAGLAELMDNWELAQ